MGLPMDAAQRVLERDMACLPECQMISAERKVWKEISQKYGVKTQYSRTVFHAKMTESLEHVESCCEDTVHPDRCVYIFRTKELVSFCAWIPPSEFEWLQSPAGQEELQRRVACYEVMFQI